MSIRVDLNQPLVDGNKPITVWWDNHNWTDMTSDEARVLYEALQDALGERGTFRLTPEQAKALQHMGE